MNLNPDVVNLSPSAVFAEVQRMFYTEYTVDEWKDKITESLPKSTCGISWPVKMFAIHCEDCQKSPCSCVCLTCFLNGNHQGHKASIRYSSNASCDCGDPMLWKESGFCSYHPGCCEHPEKTDIDPETYAKYEEAFIKLIRVFPYAIEGKDSSASDILDFLLTHTSYGDAIRRTLTIVLPRYADIPRIFDKIHLLDENNIEKLATLLSNLSNDHVFRRDLSPYLISCMPIIANRCLTVALKAESKENPHLRALREFSKSIFHWYSCMEESEVIISYDWVSAAINTIRPYLHLIRTSQNHTIIKNSKLADFVGHLADLINKNADMKDIGSFTIKFANELVNIEGTREFHREVNEKVDDEKKVSTTAHNADYTLSSIISAIDDIEGAFFPEVFDVYINYLKTKTANYTSVLNPVTQISFIVALHSLLNVQLKKSKDIPKWLNYIAKGTGLTLAEACSRIAYLPMKLFAASRYGYSGRFARNDESTLIGLISVAFKANLSMRFSNFYSLIQICIENTPDINGFMKDMATTFGVFDTNPEDKSFAITQFIIDSLFFVTDRSCFINDQQRSLDETIIAILKCGPKPFEDISNSLPSIKNYVLKIPASVKRLTNATQSGSKTIYSLKDGFPWSLGCPWIKSSYVFDIITKFTTLNKDVPFQIQLPTDERSKALNRILTTPAVIYAVLNLISKTQNISDRQIVNAYILALNQIGLKVDDPKKEPVTVKVTDDLSNLPKTLTDLVINKYIVGDTEVQISELFKKNQETITVLERLGFEVAESTNQVDKKARNKARAAAAKERAFASINMNISQFDTQANDVDGEDKQAEVTCSVCNEIGTEPLYLPTFYHRTIIPSMIDNKELEARWVATACQHAVHKDCIDVGEETKQFTCPICRIVKNDLIPLCNNVEYDATKELNQDFLGSLLYKENPFTIDGANMIAASLTMLEARFRNNPGALDNPANKMLFQSMFSHYWRHFHTHKNQEIIDDNVRSIESSGDSLISLIAWLIMADKPVKEFKILFQRELNSKYLSNDSLIPFLRRVSIFYTFVFEEAVGEDFDWDDWLDYGNICKRFGIAKNENAVEPKQVKLINLPDSPIHLFELPFDQDKMTYDTVVWRNCFDRQIYTKVTIEGYKQLANLEEDCKGSVVPMIQLTGKDALKFSYFSWDMNRILKGPPVYFTMLGQPARGLESSDILELNKDRVAQIEDDLLSGNFVKFDL